MSRFKESNCSTYESTAPSDTISHLSAVINGKGFGTSGDFENFITHLFSDMCNVMEECHG